MFSGDGSVVFSAGSAGDGIEVLPSWWKFLSTLDWAPAAQAAADACAQGGSTPGACTLLLSQPMAFGQVSRGGTASGHDLEMTACAQLVAALDKHTTLSAASRVVQALQLAPANTVRSTRAAQTVILGEVGSVDGVVLRAGDYGGRQLQFGMLRDFGTSITVAGGVSNADIFIGHMARRYKLGVGDGVVFSPGGKSPARRPMCAARGARSGWAASGRLSRPLPDTPAAGGTITNVSLSHFSVCQAIANCVVFEGPGTLQDVTARGNFVLLGNQLKLGYSGPTSALLVRGSAPPTLAGSTSVAYQATEPVDEPGFVLVRNTSPAPVAGLRFSVEGWCGNFASVNLAGLPPGQVATGARACVPLAC